MKTLGPSFPIAIPYPLHCRRTRTGNATSNACHRNQYSTLDSQFVAFPGPRKRFRFRSSINGEKADESRFLDEDGVVEDMDGYLNYLSLEYDSVWDTKPSWCQPWTILLAGVAVVTCSWGILHSAAISGGVAILICGWWYIFLYAYPKAYSEMIAERRKRVSSGIEDTYGHGYASLDDQLANE